MLNKNIDKRNICENILPMDMGHLTATVTTQIEPTSSITNRIVLKNKHNILSDEDYVNKNNNNIDNNNNNIDNNNNNNNNNNNIDNNNNNNYNDNNLNNCVNNNCYNLKNNNYNINHNDNLIDQQNYNNNNYDNDNNNNNNNNNNINKNSDGDNVEVVNEINLNYNLGFKAPLKWGNIIGIFFVHGLFLFGLFNPHKEPVSIIGTIVWGFLIGGIGGFGVTGGAHRLWTHKAYKAKLPLRIILMLCFTLSGQNTLYDWVRDHRVHHKFSETDADPHNANRGFFFAHVGWLMMNKHPEVLRKGKTMDMSDISSDPVVQFHQKYFIPLKMVLCFILPTIIPMYLWSETFYWAFFSQCVFRYVLNLNFTWLVNSAAHLWGTRPYDKSINPAENLAVSIVAMGEGWHNYHHVFPWDYKAAELANYFNATTFYINQFAKIGWAYDLKQPTPELIQKTIEKCGDGSHPKFGHHLTEVPPPDEGFYDSKNS